MNKIEFDEFLHKNGFNFEYRHEYKSEPNNLYKIKLSESKYMFVFFQPLMITINGKGNNGRAIIDEIELYNYLKNYIIGRN